MNIITRRCPCAFSTVKSNVKQEKNYYCISDFLSAMGRLNVAKEVPMNELSLVYKSACIHSTISFNLENTKQKIIKV